MTMVVSSTLVLVRAEFLHALAKPTRLSILEALREGPLLLSGLVLVTGIEESMIVRELVWLRGKDLVAAKQRGKFAYYYLSDTRISLLLRLIDELSVVTSAARNAFKEA